MPLPSGTLLGPYEILSAIGSGGMGEVYRARDTRVGRIVAIKTLSPHLASSDKVRRFEREALGVSALNHPHICAFYDIGQDGPLDFLVMEYVEGETLERRMMRGPLPVDEALAVARQVTDALDHMHRQGITHRDLKPSNIMLSGSGAKLLDFGLAKFEGEPSAVREGALLGATQSLTAEGSVVGTLQYMAPEQLEGGPVDHRVDFFALGAVLYEMVTGQQAFTGDSLASRIAAILSREPAAPSNTQPLVPWGFDRLVARCLAKDPEDRWQNARDLLAELTWVAGREAVDRGATPSAGRRWRQRIAWTVGTVASAAAIVIATIWLITRRHGEAGGIDSAQFLIPPPPGAEFSTGGGLMAVSPDGRFLSFVATDATGQTVLWLRPLNSTVPRLLEGTQGAGQPFWSADSRFLAFSVLGAAKLRKVDLSTGSIETICDTPGYPLGGTWSADGVILFSTPSTRQLYSVRATGGVPTPLTMLDRSRGDLAHHWPSFLPDGRHFVYLIISTHPDRTGVYVGSLDSHEEASRILPVASNALYAPDGYLLYQLRAALVAQRFDARTLQLTGEPVVLAEQVAQNASTKRVVASVSSNGLLAYRTVADTELVWFDQQGVRLGTVGVPGQYSSPVLSPDERRVALSRQDSKAGTDDIWTIEVANGRMRRLTFDAAWDTQPVWSPDGNRILFQSDRLGSFSLFETMADGSGQNELVRNSSGLQPRDWTGDGPIAYESTARRLVLVGIDGPSTAGTRSAFDFGAQDLKVSPDRRWMAYTSDESNVDEVYVRPYEAAPHGALPISVRGGSAPRWRGDGKELFYLAADQTIMAVSVSAGRGFERSSPRPLFRIRSTDARGRPIDGFDVSRDGLRFLVNQPSSDITKSITVVLNWPNLLRH